MGIELKTDLIDVQEKKPIPKQDSARKGAKEQKKKKKKQVNLAALGVPTEDLDPTYAASPIKGVPLPIDMNLLEDQVTEIYSECEEKAEAPEFFFAPSQVTM